MSGEGPPHGRAACPRCRRPGSAVGRKTVAGATVAPLPALQELYLCRSTSCELLYFGAAGATIPVSAAARRPWFKDGGEVACFCFGLRSTEVSATAIAEVTGAVRRRECACELRNPSGRCCLADLSRLQRSREGGDTAVVG